MTFNMVEEFSLYRHFYSTFPYLLLQELLNDIYVTIMKIFIISPFEEILIHWFCIISICGGNCLYLCSVIEPSLSFTEIKCLESGYLYSFLVYFVTCYIEVIKP